jgi:hypothetical protein
VIEVPQVDGDYVVNENEISHLSACEVAAILTKEFDPSLGLELVELVVSHAGHSAFVLFMGTVHIEIPKPHDLGLGFFKCSP